MHAKGENLWLSGTLPSQKKREYIGMLCPALFVLQPYLICTSSKDSYWYIVLQLLKVYIHILKLFILYYYAINSQG
jgi:hypothetical protein